MYPWAQKSAPAVALLACAAPLFAMTVHGWSNGALFLASALSIVLLAFGHLPAAPADRRVLVRLVVIALAAPLATTIFSAVLRGDPASGQFDAPLRSTLAIPIFLVALRCRLDVSRGLRWTLPATVVLLAAHRAWFGQPERWPADRVTTAFADPLVFGYLSLAFALMCLMSISFRDGERSSRTHDVVALVGIATGMVLSVLSESRSGWAALPVIVAVWLYFNVQPVRRAGPAALPFAALLATVVIGASAYALVPKVHERLDQAIGDVTSYSFSGQAPVSPVGLRITYLRIASDIVARHPVEGIGDTSHKTPPPVSQFPYANQFALNYAYGSAFHNQIVSDAVRHGVLGGLAAALLLVVPIVVYVRGLRHGDRDARHNAALGIAYGAVLFVTSFSTEVVDLKYTASLYALLTAVLCGGALARHGQD
jgi:O-antigen ligase